MILNNSAIDQASEVVADFLTREQLDLQEIIRIRLSVEELLLEYQIYLGEDTQFSLNCVKRFGKLRIELALPGRSLDPFAEQAEAPEEGAELMRSLLAGMGYAPVWQYKNGKNLVTFSPKKKQRSQFRTMAAAVAAAVLLGSLCRLLPEAVGAFLMADLVQPLFDTFMGILSAVAGPMIFLSVAWGLYSIGDTATLGRIGKRMIQRFLGISALVGVGSALLFLPFFPMMGGGQGQVFQFQELFQLILDMIPGNLLTPFTDNNPTQIVVVGAMLGVAMLVLGGKASSVAALVEQSNTMVQLLMEWLTHLVPFFIFCSMFNLIAGDGLSILKQCYRLLPLMLLAHLLMLLLYIAAICIRKRVSLPILLKKLAPACLIGLMTASSTAAFATNVESCRRDLGIDPRIINFGIPLGQVLFMPGLLIKFLISALCMAEIYQVELTLGWLVTAVLISVVLAAAAPPVPGGSMSCFTMLFLQLGLPAEAIAVIIALNVILDFISTAVNITSLQLELVELSGSLNMLDLDMLRQEKA